MLVPQAPFGSDGWRWVVLIGSAGAIVVWFLRRGLPKSPRWLINQGRVDEANQVTSAIECAVLTTNGRFAVDSVRRVDHVVEQRNVLFVHACQSELFPTRMRARAVGFTYSFSRISTVFASFIIGFFPRKDGVTGVFVLIAFAMLVVVLSIGFPGPRTKDLQLEQISH
jgi:MFS family permease